MVLGVAAHPTKAIIATGGTDKDLKSIRIWEQQQPAAPGVDSGNSSLPPNNPVARPIDPGSAAAPLAAAPAAAPGAAS